MSADAGSADFKSTCPYCKKKVIVEVPWNDDGYSLNYLSIKEAKND